MSKTIALIGLSGCGKSTYGLELSRKLDRPFYDIDQMIEEKIGMTVAEIFSKEGEDFFRAMEWEVFMTCCVRPDCVIATGGGLVPTAYSQGKSKPQNIFFLYLNTSIDEIERRLSNPDALGVRPLMTNGQDLRKQIEKLYNERSKAYLAWADGVLSTI